MRMQMPHLSLKSTPLNWKNWLYIALLIFFTLFYFLALPRLGLMGDYFPNVFLPYSILKNFSFYLDDFEMLIQEGSDKVDRVNFNGKVLTNTGDYYAPYLNGHYVSAYPVLTSLLALPFYSIYFLMYGFPSPNDWAAFQLLSSISGSILSATAVCVMLFFLRKLNEETADYLIFFYGGATLILSIGNVLHNHLAGLLFLPLAWFYALKSENQEEKNNVGWSGFFAALATLGRTTNGISYMALLAYCIFRKKDVKRYLIYSLPLLFALFMYNYAMFGSPLDNGYNYIHKNANGGYTHWTEIMQLDATFFNNFLALLISPNKGMLFFSPFLLFAILGGYKAFKGKDETAWLMRFIIFAFLATVAFFSAWLMWAAARYGYIVLLDIVVYPMLLVGYASKEIFSNRIFLCGLIVLGLISVPVALIGTIGECNWSVYPRLIDEHKERVWDLQDLQITRCFRNMRHWDKNNS